MASSRRPTRKTTSWCAPETDRCVHVFEIDRYSLHKGIDDGDIACIRSATFSVGGHDWCIRFCTYKEGTEGSKDYVSVYLELLSKTTEVRTVFSVKFVRRDAGFPRSRTSNVAKFTNDCSILGFKKFMKKSDLEASPYLRDDRLVIECHVTVILETSVSESETVSDIEVSPSDLSDNLGKLLETQKGADVSFKVKEEVFHAHKIVLAMRSRVFEAQLYGPVGENQKPYIVIEDMEPSIFKALLQFIYTDSLPTMDDLDGDEKEEMVKHLLVAADRYDMERMKLVCENILSKRLSAENVSTTLAIADQHHCIKLKNACIGFFNSLDRNRMDAVVGSQGYEHLKRACPAVFVEIWEKAAKSRKF